MSKLSLDALKKRAEAVASEELLATISGGTENACHDMTPIMQLPTPPPVNIPRPTVPKPSTGGIVIVTF